MNHRTHGLLSRSLLALSLLCGLLGLPLVAAGAEEGSAAAQETRRVPAIKELVYKRLAKVQEAVDLKDYATAIQEIEDAYEMRGLNENETASIANMEAFVRYSQEDYPGAIRAYQKVIAGGDKIPAGLELSAHYALAQLYFVDDKFDESIFHLDRWFALNAAEIGPKPFIFKAQVMYSKGDYRGAIPVVKQAMDRARAMNLPIEENHWLLLRVLHYELEEWPEVLEILELLVRDFPKPEYWKQLAGVYGQLEMDKKQIWAMELAYVQGYLDREAEILNLSGLLMQEEVPARAARILARAIEAEIVEPTSKNLQMLGQAWQLAQEVERAIPVFEDAARKSDEGEIYARLSQLYLGRDDHASAIKAADNAFEKGGLRNPDDIWIVKGMSLFELDRLGDAIDAFRQAQRISRREDDQVGANIASQWLRYVDRENERRRQLAQSAAGP